MYMQSVRGSLAHRPVTSHRCMHTHSTHTYNRSVIHVRIISFSLLRDFVDVFISVFSPLFNQSILHVFHCFFKFINMGCVIDTCNM